MNPVKKKFQKYFIPSIENDHKPHFLREKNIKIALLFSVIVLFAGILGSYAVKNNSYLAAVKSAFLVDLANESRVENGFGRLALNDTLVSAARLKASDMAEKSYFAHTSPEGLTPWHWFDLAGYNYLYAGENLAVNFNRSEDVNNAWMESPLHRANILSGNFTEIGISTAEGIYKGKKTTFVVQMFGSPFVERRTNQASVNQVENIPEPNSLPSLPGDAVLGAETEKEVESPSFVTTRNPYAPEEADELIEDTEPVQEEYTNWFQRIIVSPNEIVNYIYIGLAFLIVFALILKIFVEVRKQHWKNIIYGILLLAIVLIFMYINRELLIDPIIVASF